MLAKNREYCCGKKKCLKEDGFFSYKYKGFYVFDLIKLITAIILFFIFLTLSFTALDYPKMEDSPFYYTWQKGVLFSFFFINIMVIGYDLLWGGIKNLFHFKFNELSLMLIAILAAFIIGEFIEGVIVIILFKIGDMLEEYAVEKTEKNISELIKIQPNKATLLINNQQKEVDAKDVSKAQTIIIRPGDKVPLDCIVISGSSSLDTSALTGEIKYYDVVPGDKLLSGTININGVLVCKTTNDFNNSTASKIVKMISDATNIKSKSEKFISKFASIYTPIIILCSILIATIPLIWVLSDWVIWLNASLAFLLAACPCALVISIPLAYFCCIGLNSKKGVLIKGSKFVESLAKIEIIYFDKTNTITDGQLNVSEILTFNNFSKDIVVSYISACEKYSNHPIAKAIVKKFKSCISVEEYAEIPGYGISGLIDGKKVFCGNRRLMTKNNITVPEIDYIIGSIIYLAIDNVIAGIIILDDSIRPGIKETMKKFLKLNVKHLIILSGDNNKIVEKVAHEADVASFYGELLPEQKVEKMDFLKHNHKVIAFVGDGINDAPSLAKADVGVAMGLGNGIAIETSDVILGSNNIGALADAIEVSQRTIKINKFNVCFILGIKFLVFLIILVCSATIGVPLIWLGVLADVGLTIFCIFNASRILTFNRNKKRKT